MTKILLLANSVEPDQAPDHEAPDQGCTVYFQEILVWFDVLGPIQQLWSCRDGFKKVIIILVIPEIEIGPAHEHEIKLSTIQ